MSRTFFLVNMAKNLISLTKEGVLEVNSILEDYISDPGYVKKDSQTGCLLWLGARGGGNGYREPEYSTMWLSSNKGNFKSFRTYVHIVQLFLKTGEVPTRGKSGVSHICHRKLCVNPSHIFLETLKSNNKRKLCNGTPGCKKECKDPRNHTPQCFSET